MTPGEIPPLYELIQPGKEIHRFKGLDELMEMKYGWMSQPHIGGNMNLRRGALYAFLFGVFLLVGPALVGNVYPPIMSFVRGAFGWGTTYFAVQGFLNFATSSLPNLVGLMAFTAAVILYGLSRRQRVV